MLVLSRSKKNPEIQIVTPCGAVIMIETLGPRPVKLGVTAPIDFTIIRSELRDEAKVATGEDSETIAPENPPETLEPEGGWPLLRA